MDLGSRVLIEVREAMRGWIEIRVDQSPRAQSLTKHDKHALCSSVLSVVNHS